MKKLLLLTVFGFSLIHLHPLYARDAVFDMHMHYKWSQQNVTTPEDAIGFMDKENISHAVVMGNPPEFSLKLKLLAPERITAIYSPYKNGNDWFLWQRRESIVTESEAALKSGDYQGIGELHIIGGGFARRLTDASVLGRLLKLAEKYDVPILLHTEFSRPNYMLKICNMAPKTKIVWAHAGAILKPEHVDEVMSKCPNVWSGMGASDPWRYNQHTDGKYRIKPDWKALLMKYPNRFMVGSDTVWPVDEMDSWHTDDTGWQELSRFWGFHRKWLAQLPNDIAQKIMRENAMKLFNKY